MSMMGSHNEAPVSDEVDLDGEETEERLAVLGNDPKSPNTHTAATMKLDSPPAPESNPPNPHSAPTVILRPPQMRD